MNCSAEDILAAATVLKQGALVAFPTETVYGLGANALLDTAVAMVYAVKERPAFNPLIVHVASADAAKKYVQWTEMAEQLAKQFWPGPLTLVLNRRRDCALSLLLSAGMETVAIRVPAHPVARELLEASGLPIAAPSANRSGRISPTEASHVHEELGGRGITILDGGMCPLGLESTVVDARGECAVILRPGGITAEQLRDAGITLGELHAGGGYVSPGMLASHYAPQTRLRLDATEVKNGEALLAFGDALPYTGMCENLSSQKNLQEAAANLFRMLRSLDASGAAAIAVMKIPDTGLGVAINDRLKRAAA